MAKAYGNRAKQFVHLTLVICYLDLRTCYNDFRKELIITFLTLIAGINLFRAWETAVLGN